MELWDVMPCSLVGSCKKAAAGFSEPLPVTNLRGVTRQKTVELENTHTHTHIYIYIYIYTHLYIYIYSFIYIYVDKFRIKFYLSFSASR
jgi:hypothetical protein